MEHKPVPKVLSRFTEDLIRKQRPFVSIKAEPLNCDLSSDPLDLKASKFLGTPYVPEGMDYPVNKEGNPLVLIAQINFSEVPTIQGFPSDGILQLYLDSSEWWDMSGTEKIIYISAKELDKPARKDMPAIEPEAYEELPVWTIHKLTFESSIDTGNSEDSQFDFDFGGKDFWEFEESLSEEEKKEFDAYFDGDGHKIGGYAYFTQGDPRDYSDRQRDDIQLLQLDSDEEMMFGDSGIGHIFIPSDALENRDFSKSYFYWDCC